MKKGALFNSVKVSAPKKNMFDLSHDFKFSGNMGELIPTMLMDCVPGDKVNLTAESLIRLAPMVAPMMHRCDVYFHWFFVPNRILWPNWEKYITNTPIDSEGNLPAFPYLKIEGDTYTSLADYLGVPKTQSPDFLQVSALPFAAYQLIFNEYYRDQNLMPDRSELLKLVDGNNNGERELLTTLHRRCWEHDYFTAALPFAQKGAAVTLPLAGMNDVRVMRSSDDGAVNTFLQGTSGNPNQKIFNRLSENPDIPDNELYADTSSLEQTSTTINDLRRAFRLQEWLERLARGGSRYAELLKNFFNVNSSDKRLQRPEYITGMKSPIVISEVLNTTGTEDAPQGNMAGHGVSVTAGNGGSYFCEEHGYIMGIMSVMPRTAYQQGVPKHFLKINDPFEFYWEQFAHIGEQPVLNAEVFAQGLADDNETFGYVPRYAEYKFMQNRVAGEFKTSLDMWHMGRKFDTPPALNAEFVTCNPTNRVFAVEDPTVAKLYCHVYNKVSALRPMPVFGTPTF